MAAELFWLPVLICAAMPNGTAALVALPPKDEMCSTDFDAMTWFNANPRKFIIVETCGPEPERKARR